MHKNVIVGIYTTSGHRKHPYGAVFLPFQLMLVQVERHVRKVDKRRWLVIRDVQ